MQINTALFALKNLSPSKVAVEKSLSATTEARNKKSKFLVEGSK
jgi:hypothetical protein